MAHAMSELVLRVSSKRYPGHSFVFFHGSHSRPGRNPTPASDVDLLVIFTQDITPFRESFIAGGFLFDVFVYDAESINFLLNDRRRHDTVLLGVLADAIVLPTSTDQSQHLQAMARLRLLDTPVKTDSSLLRHTIMSTLNSLEWCTDADQRTLLLVNTYKWVVKLLLRELGKAGHNNKHAVKAIESHAPGFFSGLNAALTDALQRQDVRHFSKVVEEIVAGHGGLPRQGFKFDLPAGHRLALSNSNFKLNKPTAKHLKQG